MPHPVSPAAALLLAGLLALQACGGGGGDSSDAAPAAAPSGSGTPGGTIDAGGSGSGVTPSADIGCGQTDFEAEALRLVNLRRAAGANCGARGSFAAAPALRWQAQLASAAHGHSVDMATRDYFSHTGFDGRSAGERVTASGYAWSTTGENIAAGYPTTQAVVDGWMGSAGHCANLMNPNYTEMGLACAQNGASRYGRYWTQTLARPR